MRVSHASRRRELAASAARPERDPRVDDARADTCARTDAGPCARADAEGALSALGFSRVTRVTSARCEGRAVS